MRVRRVSVRVAQGQGQEQKEVRVYHGGYELHQIDQGGNETELTRETGVYKTWPMMRRVVLTPPHRR